MPVLARAAEPLALMFADDGSIPNNPRLPLLIYRNAVDLSGTPDPEDVIEATFARHGWRDMWRNGIFPYVHYHSMIHEALAIARGDVMVLPAGTGHQCLWESPELCVIGAYPKGGKYDLCRGSKAEHAKAIESIANVPVPDSDPVYGEDGPLIRLWRP
jgi:uncharacterized protein YjlB